MIRPVSKPLFVVEPPRTLWWCSECKTRVPGPDHKCGDE